MLLCGGMGNPWAPVFTVNGSVCVVTVLSLLLTSWDSLINRAEYRAGTTVWAALRG